MTRAEVEAYADANGCSLVMAAGFDDCIVGVAEQSDEADEEGIVRFIVYDRAKVLNSLLRDGLTLEAAEEFYATKLVGQHHGVGTPCFLVTSPTLM